MTALAGKLRSRLEKLGQNVDKLTSEKGQLAQVLTDAKARLEELRKQKAAAEARAATFRNLVARLKSMIDAGQLKVVIRDGRMLIALPNDVLFDSGKTNIKPDGQTALAQVAKVLSTIPDRNFLVAGDTDDVPIHTARFPSNWGLRAWGPALAPSSAPRWRGHSSPPRCSIGIWTSNPRSWHRPSCRPSCLQHLWFHFRLACVVRDAELSLSRAHGAWSIPGARLGHRARGQNLSPGVLWHSQLVQEARHAQLVEAGSRRSDGGCGGAVCSRGALDSRAALANLIVTRDLVTPAVTVTADQSLYSALAKMSAFDSKELRDDVPDLHSDLREWSVWPDREQAEARRFATAHFWHDAIRPAGPGVGNAEQPQRTPPQRPRPAATCIWRKVFHFEARMTAQFRLLRSLPSRSRCPPLRLRQPSPSPQPAKSTVT